MALAYKLIATILLLTQLGLHLKQVDAININYYIQSCPLVDLIIKTTVLSALRSDPTLAAGLVRMHFHDCFIEGCDGSVLLDSTKDNTAEKDSPANLSLRGFEIVDTIKQKLEEQCPGVVSCADILAMAARDAVFFARGPFYEIPKGRMDGRRSKIEDTINLPFATFNSSELIAAFEKHGFSVEEMVALSGAHTLGVARCSSFKNRLNEVADGQSLDSEFAKTLSNTCNRGDNAEQPFDTTKNSFDNDYYNRLRRKSGLLTSDQTLFASPRTRGIVNSYAMNQAEFFSKFQRAMFKMGLLDIKGASNGEVRDNCRRIN